MSIPWGIRGDVPLPGLNFDGNAATPELAVYRPEDKYIYWTSSYGGAAHAIEVRGAANQVVHLHGYYDGDLATDVVVYEPAMTPES